MFRCYKVKKIISPAITPNITAACCLLPSRNIAISKQETLQMNISPNTSFGEDVLYFATMKADPIS